MTTAPATDVRQHILSTAQAIMGGKGFSGVGLTEILQAAGVPKGSFYHYFGSKEAFGEALLQFYFAGYMSLQETILTRPGATYAERVMDYWEYWVETQAADDPMGKCLIVKLSAEVSDLSEPMRLTLKQGVDLIITRLAQAIEDGVAQGSLHPASLGSDVHAFTTTLYHLWLGTTLRAKITRDRATLETALLTTRHMLGLPVSSSR